jgi:uncharacterized protein YbjT (DUF2867 family)
MGFAAIDAARDAGVKHFVFSSVLHAILTDLIQHEIKRVLEEYLLSSGLEFTILQPANYMLRHRLMPAFQRGVFALTWSLDRLQSMVDLGDVAEVAAVVLTAGPTHFGATYELAAPGRFSAHDLANIISGVTGHSVSAEQIDSEVFLKKALAVESLEQFPYQTRLLKAISKRYSSHDFVGNPNVLTWLLGRQPTTFEQFVQREFAAFQAAAAGQPGRAHV